MIYACIRVKSTVVVSKDKLFSFGISNLIFLNETTTHVVLGSDFIAIVMSEAQRCFALMVFQARNTSHFNSCIQKLQTINDGLENQKCLSF